MFCIQCEQTKQGGCQVRSGNCGKTEVTADLQDVLIMVLQGISAYASRARALGAVDDAIDRFMPGAYFTTLTNVNFDEDFFVDLIGEALALRDAARDLYLRACRDQNLPPAGMPTAATWQPGKTKEELVAASPLAALNKDVDKVGHLQHKRCRHPWPGASPGPWRPARASVRRFPRGSARRDRRPAAPRGKSRWPSACRQA